MSGAGYRELTTPNANERHGAGVTKHRPEHGFDS
ncbi:hypothetical protein Hoch_0112 [Haliangium ochraceum DSM 14365]|uniref:Uncharacterized protein n=1 Tax=Haliangium ochraceum (strain DSM 14365 / JCM 11303 / SMP-2) TaxID=502025 RepID=D0LGK7_HALO1|nr:hypothetical protein Hoch_0112 [Haliangium ochraceum DSM 14365]